MKRGHKKDRSRPDHYSVRARKDNYPARSVYKLEEIQRKYRLIRPKDRVLDLGCAPGSWLLFAAKQTGASGRVVGIDLKPLTDSVPDNVRVYTADVTQLDDEQWSEIGDGFDVVLSDMAPATTGHREVDSARSFALCESALDIAGRLLAPGGNFVTKIFQGKDFEPFIESVRQQFKTRKIFKPQSCRKESKEIYVIGIGKKQEV